ncbi:hypothetical protein [Christiangramia sp. SM2212]|uniref:Uncharacterized protein n=1 Tax=Christiangramia sediminicola TaxID=3073267 RepID=A0ABU1EL42_9FLAO|nr:hypothetical protein [Christiangramia sp. SM2212]MDR5589099.1 hypothetical protein [Christiangramia sp. SM2212]
MKKPFSKVKKEDQKISLKVTFLTNLVLSLFLFLIMAVILLVTPDSVKTFGLELIKISIALSSIVFYYLRTNFSFIVSFFQCLVNTLLTYAFALILKEILTKMEVGHFVYLIMGILIFSFYSINKQLIDKITHKLTGSKTFKSRIELF